MSELHGRGLAYEMSSCANEDPGWRDARAAENREYATSGRTERGRWLCRSCAEPLDDAKRTLSDTITEGIYRGWKVATITCPACGTEHHSHTIGE